MKYAGKVHAATTARSARATVLDLNRLIVFIEIQNDRKPP